MVSLIKQIKADRGDGTPGPWALDGIAISHLSPPHGYPIDVCLMGEPLECAGDVKPMLFNHKANARRIARVPAMEAALIAADALAEAGERLRDEMIMRQGLARHEAKQAYNAALAAYRKATEAAQ